MEESPGSYYAIARLQQPQFAAAILYMRRRALFKIFVSVLMVSAGTINVLAVKWADTILARGTNPKAEHLFLHPYVQVLSMFGGKASCLVVFQIVYYYYYYYHKKVVFQFGRQDFSPFVFVIPAVFNVLGTSTMYFGLSLTFASSYQMLRGAVIIFTALLSVAVFGSKLQVYHWVGMLTVVTGSALVSLGDLLNTSYDLNQNGLFTGDLLVVIGQIAVALQLITEQRYVQGYNIPPLQAVGWEGVFGFGIVGIALVPMYFIRWHLPSESYFWQDHTRYEDVIDAVNQIVYIPTLIVAFVCATVSSGFYNFAGMSVTKEVNATTRTVLDSVSALFIWMFGLVFMWQQFNFYQLIGFLVLLVGICIYYTMCYFHG